MARFNYSSYLKKEEAKDKGDFKVSFFGLKDDGDEATVRFAYNSTDEFHLATVHSIEVDGKPRRVSCLRTGTEPLSKCPLCEAGNRVYDKMYVKLIQYTTDSNGQVLLHAHVWERPAFFSKTLEDLFKEYGVVSDSIFKIKRNGKKGDTKTTYAILFANPAIYKPEIYVKDFSAFDDFEINKFFYTEKTADEMRVFLQTGKFPDKVKDAVETIAPAVSTSASVATLPSQTSTTLNQSKSVPPQPVTSQPETFTHAVSSAPAKTVVTQPVTTGQSVDNSDPTVQRPRRYTY